MTTRANFLKRELDGSVFVKLDGSRLMTGNLNMDNNRKFNLPLPTRSKQPTTVAFTDLKYLHIDGTSAMGGNLNINNESLIHLRPLTSDTDEANEKYVDDSIPNTSSFLKKDGSVTMTGDLNIDDHKIANLKTPTSNSDAATKSYIDSLIHHTSIQPSHFKDQIAFLMSNSNQWTDEIDGGNSFNITKIDDLPPSNGNFHDYNH